MYLYSFPFAQFLEFFSCVWHVWNYYGDVVFIVVRWIVVVVVDGLVGIGKFVMPLVEGPVWKLTLL